MASLLRVQQPGIEPITLAEAKRQLEVDATDWDTLIGTLISAARSQAESFLKMSIMATPWACKIDFCFPSEIRLPIGPVFDPEESPASFSITYIDDAGAEQTLATTEYQVSYGETAVIRPAYSKTWPTTRSIMDAVTVNFVAGWHDPEDIPAAIRHGISLILADSFANRESSAEMPVSARNVMMPFVRHD